MNNIIVLTKILIKSGDVFQTKQSNKRMKWIALIALAIGAIAILAQISYLVVKTYDVLTIIHQQNIIMDLGLTLSCFLVFFFGIFYVISVFYFAEDIKTLLHLPLRPFEILGAKFVVVTIYEYLSSAIILLPVLVIYGIKSNFGILYYLYSLIVFISLPIVPLVIASIPVVIIMRFSNIAKNKDRFRMIAGFIGLFFAVGFSFLSQKITNLSINNNQLQDMLTSMKLNIPIVNLLNKIFPTSLLFSKALLNNFIFQGLLWIMAGIVTTGIFYIAFLFMAEQLYLKASKTSMDSYSKQNIPLSKLQKEMVKEPAFYTYFMKELKILIRTPSYFINCIIMNFFWPVILLLPFFAGTAKLEQLRVFAGILTEQKFAGLVLAGCFCGVLFISASNGIAASAISREGNNIGTLKSIPIKYSTQIFSKILPACLWGIIAMLMLVLTLYLIAKPGAMLLALTLIVCTCGVVLTSLIGISIDLYNPKLNWSSEQEAVKQNINILLNMVISVLLASGIFYLIYRLRCSLVWTFTTVVGICFIVILLIIIWIMHKGIKLFSDLKV